MTSNAKSNAATIINSDSDNLEIPCDVVEKYKDLNDKCDLVLVKIKQRKQKVKQK